VTTKILIRDLEHLTTVVSELDKNNKYIAIDVETHDYTGESSALDMIDAEVVGIGIAVKDRAWYVDFTYWTETNPAPENYLCYI